MGRCVGRARPERNPKDPRCRSAAKSPAHPAWGRKPGSRPRMQLPPIFGGTRNDLHHPQGLKIPCPNPAVGATGDTDLPACPPPPEAAPEAPASLDNPHRFTIASRDNCRLRKPGSRSDACPNASAPHPPRPARGHLRRARVLPLSWKQAKVVEETDRDGGFRAPKAERATPQVAEGRVPGPRQPRRETRREWAQSRRTPHWGLRYEAARPDAAPTA